MTITRVTSEKVLVKRLGPLMAAGGMSVTVLGTNVDLNDPLAWATRQMGDTTSNIDTVTDAELTGVSGTDDFLDLAEYRTLQNILGALDDVDLTAGPRTEKFNQLVLQTQKKLDRLEERVGDLLNPMTASYISLDFVEHGEAAL